MAPAPLPGNAGRHLRPAFRLRSARLRHGRFRPGAGATLSAGHGPRPSRAVPLRPPFPPGERERTQPAGSLSAHLREAGLPGFLPAGGPYLALQGFQGSGADNLAPHSDPDKDACYAGARYGPLRDCYLTSRPPSRNGKGEWMMPSSTAHSVPLSQDAPRCIPWGGPMGGPPMRKP